MEVCLEKPIRILNSLPAPPRKFNATQRWIPQSIALLTHPVSSVWAENWAKRKDLLESGHSIEALPKEKTMKDVMR